MAGRFQIFTGTFVHTPSPDILSVLENAAVFVDRSGTIVHIDEDVSLPDARLNNDLEEWSGAEIIFTRPRSNEFFFPGFVDTHIHASQYPNAGIFGQSSLLGWLEEYTFPLEASLMDRGKARRVYSRCIMRTLANGTTTAAYFATRSVESTNLLADLCLKSGQRAFVGRCCMDQNSPDYYRDADAVTSLKDTEACVQYCRRVDPERKLVCPIVTPRFVPSCSAELLKGLGDLAKREQLPVQTHISENKAEVDWVKAMFASSYADVYDAAGLLHDRTILAHAVHLTDDEMELIRTRGAKISHCPVSNLALSSGCAKVKALMKKGIKVGLGTDMSGGYSPSILEAVRQATLVSRVVALTDGEDAKLSVNEALYLATKGGADVVGLEGKVGAFEVGMQWDAIMVGIGNVPEEEKKILKPEPAAKNKRARSESSEGEDLEMVSSGAAFEGEALSGIDGNIGIGGEKTVVDDKTKPLTEGINFGLDGPVDIFGFESWEEKVAKWVYNGDDRNTMQVWVGGVEVYRAGGIPPTWSLDLS